MAIDLEKDSISPTRIYSDPTHPLVVDLDGTLIRTDLLYEGFVLLLRKNPMYLFICLAWLLKGKLYLKQKIAGMTRLRYDLLPYNQALIGFLKEEHARGRKLILATASLQCHADEIARIYPIFYKTFGTKESNLKGSSKLKLLRNELGESKFDYIGNSNSDLPVFSGSRYSYLVGSSDTIERKTRIASELKYTWKFRKSGLIDYLKAVRAYQWIKNLLIFVPLLTSHSLNSFRLIGMASAGFFAISFTASAGYIINDLMDLNSDRAHPNKRHRAFANGHLSILNGLILSVILLGAGIFIASQLNPMFLLILLIYVITSFGYSLYFKKIVLFDVFVLAALYSVRVIAGGLVTGISISFWLIAFSTFLFLSLAFVKRFSELKHSNSESGLKERGRGYTPIDLNLLQVMGIVSGYLSIVVFALYIDTPEVTRLYSHPKILWFINFIFLFWISRIWVITNRGEMTSDPILFAIKDITSYVIFFIIGVIMLISI